MPGLIAATLPLIDVDSTTTTGLLTAAATGPGVAAVELPADELCASTPAETLKTDRQCCNREFEGISFHDVSWGPGPVRNLGALVRQSGNRRAATGVLTCSALNLRRHTAGLNGISLWGLIDLAPTLSLTKRPEAASCAAGSSRLKRNTATWSRSRQQHNSVENAVGALAHAALARWIDRFEELEAGKRGQRYPPDDEHQADREMAQRERA